MQHSSVDESEANVSDKIFLDLLNNDQPSANAGGNPAAEWRLRTKRQYAIDDRLSELGQLALLSGGSLLVACKDKQVEKLERFSNWRVTLSNSPIYQHLSDVARAQLKGAKRNSYERIESAIRCFGQMICLAVRDLNEPELLDAFNSFKVQCVNYAFGTDRRNDEVVDHIKRLGKLCQAALLGARIEPLTGFCPVAPDGSVLPFVGKQLGFINDIIRSGRRTTTLDYRSAFCLAQIGNTPRSLPYPSLDQVKESIRKTLEIIQENPVTDQGALSEYRTGLRIVAATIPKPVNKTTHVSLIGSGARENPRASGGRARFLVQATRQYADKILDESYKNLVGRRDQFGIVMLKPEVWAYMELIPDVKIPVGNILYVDLVDLPIVLKDYSEGKKVPKGLGHLLNLTASMLIRELGDYNPSPKFHNGIMYFDTEDVRFQCTEIPRVRADVSIEAGLKARLVTASMAAFAHLSQLPANFMRAHLSQDPFHRVGFEESDKLWEVLKTYRKKKTSS